MIEDNAATQHKTCQVSAAGQLLFFEIQLQPTSLPKQERKISLIVDTSRSHCRQGVAILANVPSRSVSAVLCSLRGIRSCLFFVFVFFKQTVLSRSKFLFGADVLCMYWAIGSWEEPFRKLMTRDTVIR